MTPNVADFSLWQNSSGQLEVICPLCRSGSEIDPGLRQEITIRELISAASTHARSNHPVTERRTA